MPTAMTFPPAKLNLFLEIPARRNDGYHEIDTVMAAIDWRDELRVQSIPEPRIELDARWLPSREELERQLGIATPEASEQGLLDLPPANKNLVHVALQRFRERFEIRSGFRVELGKRIPAGAGMGGASSDAAHAISCAAQIHQVNRLEPLHEVAADIGSDVPFFLYPGMICHAGGRGERLTPIDVEMAMSFVVAYPPVALSTARVYGELTVPSSPFTSERFQSLLFKREFDVAQREMRNRLQEPAERILPRTSELLDSLWKSGLQTCQLTGSGSACFGIARDHAHAIEVAERLKQELQPGHLVRAVQSVAAAAPIEILEDE